MHSVLSKDRPVSVIHLCLFVIISTRGSNKNTIPDFKRIFRFSWASCPFQFLYFYIFSKKITKSIKSNIRDRARTRGRVFVSTYSSSLAPTYVTLSSLFHFVPRDIGQTPLTVERIGSFPGQYNNDLYKIFLEIETRRDRERLRIIKKTF